MKYHHVLTRLINTPLLISPEKLDVITSEVSMKLLLNQALDRSVETPEDQKVNYTIPDVAIIPISGSLINKNGAGSSGAVSYESIKEDTLAALKKGIPSIGFEISSGGGEAAGLFPLADFINSIPEKYGASTFAFVDSNANSAAYGIAAATQKIYATETANLGSIGAVQTLIDVTKLDEKQGVKYHILRSKDSKAIYNPHEEMSDKVLNDAQTNLQFWDAKFNNAINRYRPNLSLDTIVSLEGKSFYAEEALKIGLVDAIVTSLEDVIISLPKKEKPVKHSAKQSSSTLTKGNAPMTLEEALSQLTELQTTLETERAGSNLKITQAVSLERKRVTALMEAATVMKIPSTTLTKAITGGWGLDMANEVFTELAAARDEALNIDTSGQAAGLTEEQIASFKAKGEAQNKELSFEDMITTGLDVISKLPNDIFAGVR